VYAGFKKASLKNHITLTSQRKGRNAKPPEEKMSTLKTTLVQCTTQKLKYHDIPLSQLT